MLRISNLKMTKLSLFLVIFTTVYFHSVNQLKAIESGATQSIGYYTAGCIKNAAALPLDGRGYEVIRPSRKRYYGHPDLVQFIQTLGKAVASSLQGTLLIGDLSKKNGGLMSDDHRSHQIGLDADILFWHQPAAIQRTLSWQEREEIHPLSLLTSDFISIDKSRWNLVHGETVRLAAASPKVERIFVNPLIKRKLCKTYQGGEWLRKVRPWYGHDGHFHVRLSCPTDSPLCETQEPVPPGDGCDSDLDWWFTEEAKKKSLPQAPKPLPKKCLTVLAE
ncbi:MAG TPA: penicillin-insensitive murein endopeptidase [Thermodesulfobacteriota bacterium]|nr:penicillin-insensitive murein endopeptidase [Thermodesulfobacteriota bacterium]